MVRRWVLVVACAIGPWLAQPVSPVACAAGPVSSSSLIREAVEAAFKKSGREVTKKVAKESVEQAVEAAVTKFGPGAARAIADGGVELVQAASRYGDEVMLVAMKATPAARRVLAIEPSRMLPLVRELGEEAIEIEAKAPGFAPRVFSNFGDDGARYVGRQVPAEDAPRLVAYAEKADSPQTRELLLDAYKKEGASLFERIPPGMVLETGLTAGILYGTHRATRPFAELGEAVRSNPAIADKMATGVLWILGALGALVTVFILAALRLTPWHSSARNPIETRSAIQAQSSPDSIPPGRRPITAEGSGKG